MNRLAFVGMILFSFSAFSKSIHCGKTYDIHFTNVMGELPKIETTYDSVTTLFSFRDGNLLLVAMDAAEPSRLRLSISAQLNKKTGKYEGQFIADEGGREYQVDNGPEICTLQP